jgi:hypothetical protein
VGLGPVPARRGRFPAAVILVAVAASVLTALTIGSGGSPAGGLSAIFHTTSVWDGGYVGEFLITNGGGTARSWVLHFDLAAGQRITNEWNGSLSGNHPYVVTSAYPGSELAAGATVDVGFQVDDDGPYVPPGGCTLDGAPCAIGGTLAGAPHASGTTAPSTASSTMAPAQVTTTTLPPAFYKGLGRSGAEFRFSPYVDATVDTPPFDLVADLEATGTRYFTLAFVVSAAGACEASWGGYHLVGSGYYRTQIDALRAAGGDVAISFGGEAGTELADVCTSVGALEAQYRAVVDEYGVTHLDFDIEGADLSNAASMRRRFEAIAALEKSDPGLSVSVTLPVLPSGLDPAGIAVLQATISAGARIAVVNVMTMDYGDGAAPDPAGRMGELAIEAAGATHSQLATLYPGVGSAQLWRMVGVTPMLGVNDIADEVFGLSDAAQLLAFAKSVGLGELSMWAATRDVECPAAGAVAGSDTCSGVTQRPFAFSGLFAPFSG